jgi:hypothetical protein
MPKVDKDVVLGFADPGNRRQYFANFTARRNISRRGEFDLSERTRITRAERIVRVRRREKALERILRLLCKC